MYTQVSEKKDIFFIFFSEGPPQGLSVFVLSHHKLQVSQTLQILKILIRSIFLLYRDRQFLQSPGAHKQKMKNQSAASALDREGSK